MKLNWLAFFRNLDRRIIYAFVFLALGTPLYFQYAIAPARMESAEKFYDLVDNIQGGPDKIAFLSLDFGPSTTAENRPQAEVVIEHLMRKRIPFAVVSQLAESAGLLEEIPEQVAKKLEIENKGQHWQYGRDWVNLGYMVGGFLQIQAMPNSDDLRAYFRKDVRGNNLTDLPAFNQVKTIKNIALVTEITGSVGTFEPYVQFFQTADYRPPLTHGCTSITTPQAYIYLDAGQLQGLLEGIAGAAWYSELLKRHYPARGIDDSAITNTSLGVAHLVIILLVLLGNVVAFLGRERGATR